jgi:hypothetical protein
MIFVMIFFETVQHDILAKEGGSLPGGHTTTCIPFFSHDYFVGKMEKPTVS